MAQTKTNVELNESKHAAKEHRCNRWKTSIKFLVTKLLPPAHKVIPIFHSRFYHPKLGSARAFLSDNTTVQLVSTHSCFPDIPVATYLLVLLYFSQTIVNFRFQNQAPTRILGKMTESSFLPFAKRASLSI